MSSCILFSARVTPGINYDSFAVIIKKYVGVFLNGAECKNFNMDHNRNFMAFLMLID